VSASRGQASEDCLFPHDDHAERAVLGSIFIDNSKPATVWKFLTGPDSYEDAHGEILHSMDRLVDQAGVHRRTSGRDEDPEDPASER
jgi:replicative DNA helicase